MWLKCKEKRPACENDHFPLTSSSCLPDKTTFDRAYWKGPLLKVKDLVSCIHAIFEQLYAATLYRLADICQTGPFSTLKEEPNQNGILSQPLTLAIAALKLRRGVLLPKNAIASTIAEEEPLWTYAIFSASLLYGLGRVYAPISNALREENSLSALINQIVPDKASCWLKTNGPIFKAWQNAITGQLGEENPIAEFIHQAAAQSHSHSFSNPLSPENVVEVENASSLTERVGNVFIEWVCEHALIDTQRLFRVKKGLFIPSEMVDDFLLKNESTSRENLLELLLASHSLLPGNDGILHTYAPVRFEDQRTMQGIILSIRSLPERVQVLPINTYYQEYEPL